MRAERPTRPSYFGTVAPPAWDDAPVFVVGGGPSLRGRDLERLPADAWVLGVNRAADAVSVDASFTLDREFLRRYAGELRTWARTQEVYVAVSLDHHRSARPLPDVVYLERVAGRGLSTDPRAIQNGLHSGYGALNLALLKGAREIFLLGFDLTPVAPAAPTHWHSGYAWGTRSSVRYYERWAARFDDAAKELPTKFPGARVYNANPASAVRAFPFRSYEELGL